MPKIRFLWMALSLLIAPLWAAEANTLFRDHKRTPTVAILPFTNTNPDAVRDGLGQSVAAMFGTHLKNETSFAVLERAQLSRVVNEQAIQTGGLTENQREQLGKLYQVEAILTGEVSNFGGIVQLDTRLISVETGQVLVAEYAQIPQVSQIRTHIVQIAKTLELKYLRRWMGDLEVGVQPVEGEVYVDDQYLGKASLRTPLKIDNLLEGTYQLKVLASGYMIHSSTVTVQPRMRKEVQVGLKALPGSLQLLSEPAGARVWLNDRDIGVAPIALDSINEGRYRVSYQLDGFQGLTRDVEVRSGQQSEVKGILELLPASLEVTSTPAGADVYINEKRMGKTPLKMDALPPGSMNVRVSLDRYSSATKNVTVRPGEQGEWNAELPLLKGQLTVVPMTDSVVGKLLDARGKIVLNTPLPWHNATLEIGAYTLVLARAGFDTLRETILIQELFPVRKESYLQERPASLQVRSTSPNAHVWLDGQYVGPSGNNRILLPKGKHDVVIADFFDQGRDTVVLSPDEQRVVKVSVTESSRGRWLIPVGLLLSTMLLFLTGSQD